MPHIVSPTQSDFCITRRCDCACGLLLCLCLCTLCVCAHSCCVCVCAHSLCLAAPFGVRLLSVHGRQRCVFATGHCLQDLQKVLDVSRLHWGRDPVKFKCPYCHVEDFSANHWCVCPRRDSVGCTIGTARLFHQQLCTSPVEM